MDNILNGKNDPILKKHVVAKKVPRQRSWKKEADLEMQVIKKVDVVDFLPEEIANDRVIAFTRQVYKKEHVELLFDITYTNI